MESVLIMSKHQMYVKEARIKLWNSFQKTVIFIATTCIRKINFVVWYRRNLIRVCVCEYEILAAYVMHYCVYSKYLKSLKSNVGTIFLLRHKQQLPLIRLLLPNRCLNQELTELEIRNQRTNLQISSWKYKWRAKELISTSVFDYL